MACSTTRLVSSRLGLGFFLVLERVGMAHSGTGGTEPSRSAIFKLTHYLPLVVRPFQHHKGMCAALSSGKSTCQKCSAPFRDRGAVRSFWAALGPLATRSDLLLRL